MVDLRPYSRIDESSNLFVDPVVLSQILLKQKMIVANKKANLAQFIDELKNKAINAAKNDQVLYVTVRAIDASWRIRLLLYSTNIIGMVYETREGTQIIGGLAYSSFIKEVYPNNPIVKYSMGLLPIDELPDQLKEHVINCKQEKSKEKPPYIWLNKMIYDIYIDKILTEKGAYMYVLLGRDRFGYRYAVKIPREKTIEGKPLAVSSRAMGLNEVLKGVFNSLEVAHSNKQGIRESLMLRGYDEALADKLLIYRKYILYPKAIIVLRDIYTEEEYMSSPPIVIEDYADLGDLDGRIKKYRLDPREVAFIAIRSSGALGLIHANHYVHMDIKPQNILLKEDDGEPYGYAPLISDFVGTPHLFNETIELKKSTPEYADPLALIRGKAGYNYDVYSLGLTLFYAATRQKLKTRILVNLLILKNLYGTPVPLRVFLIENPDLVQIHRRLEVILRSYTSSTRKLPPEELMSNILSVIGDHDANMVKTIRKKLPDRLAKVILNAITLDEQKRYQDAISMWKDLMSALVELGYTNLIPK